MILENNEVILIVIVIKCNFDKIRGILVGPIVLKPILFLKVKFNSASKVNKDYNI